MATCSWLVSLVALAQCFVTVYSVNCNIPDERNINSCISKIGEGIKCNGESEMLKCYEECVPFASAYHELGQQAKVFEQVICEKGLQNKVMAQQDCAKEIYLQCKDVYKPDVETKDECMKNHVTFGKCTKQVKGKEKFNVSGCVELMNIIVPAMFDMCGSSSPVIAYVGTIGLAILMTFLSKKVMSP